MILAGREPHPASHHLLIKGADLGRPEDHDAVDGGTVPTFSEEHTVAENVVSAGLKVSQHLRAVIAVAIHLGGVQPHVVQHRAELLRGGDERQEHHGLAAPAVVRHLAGNLLQVGFQGAADLTDSEVSVAHAHAADVQFKRDHLRLDRAEIALPDGLGHAVFVSLGVEELAEVFHVASVGRCGNAEDIGGRKMIQNAAVAVGETVVCLVHDDVLEVVVREPGESLFLCQGLHRADRHREERAEGRGLRLFKHRVKPGRLTQFVRRLVEQFAPVRHDEDAVSFLYLVFCDRRENDGLAAACRQDEERLAIPLVPRGKDRLFRFGLIRSQLKHTRSSLLKTEDRRRL